MKSNFCMAILLVIQTVCMMMNIRANNFVLNGGFEHASSPGLPDGWGSGSWGIPPAWQNHPKLWRECFRISDEIAFEGKYSLMIDKRTDMPGLSAYSCYISPPLFLKGVYQWIFSVYVYAGQESEVSLSILDTNHRSLADKVFQVPAGAWTRLFFPGTISVNTVILRITPKTDGKFYFDAAQFEKNELTPYRDGIFDKSRLLPVVYENTAPEFVPDPKLPIGADPEITPLQYSDRTFYRKGKPFIPYAFGAGGKPSLKLMKDIRANGFNTICLYYGSVSDADLFEDAVQAGLYTVPWMRPREGEFSDMVKSRLNNPSIVTWKIIDEPLQPFSKPVLDREATARTLDPQRPVMVNYRTNEINKYIGKLAELPGQVISCDQYPLGNFLYPGTVMDCAALIAKMEAKLAPAKKTLWNWFQITGNAFMNTREPTPAEYELMLYSSLINGCRGFITFQNQPLSEELWRTAGRIGMEFQALAPVIYGEEMVLPVSLNPNIMMLGRRYNSENYLICVNSSTRKIKVDFKTQADMEVVFEQRTAQGGKDCFEPYQRHVYRWK